MEEKLWFKSYAPGVPKTIDYEKLTISQVLTRNAQRFPAKTALNYMGMRISYKAFDAMVNQCARALIDLGLKEGDKVAMVLPNLPQLEIFNLAAWRVGAVLATNNPLYTEEELAYQINDSDAKIAITLTLLVPRIQKIKSQTKLEHVIGCNINDYLPFPKKQLFPYVRKGMYKKIEPEPGVHDFVKLIKNYPGAPVEEKSRWEELGALIYTGGTTGRSKGVMLSHKNISVNVQQFRAWFPQIEDGSVALVGTFPIFHSAGFTACQNYFIWSAAEHIMIPRPEPEMLVELLKKYRPDYLPGVPTIFVGLLANEEFRKLDLHFIQGFFSGAAPLASDTIRDLKELTGATMAEVYGLSETAPIATVTPWGGVIKPGTVGVPVPDTDIKIMDLETGTQELDTGQAGEIIIGGPQIMMGYYKKPEETAETLRNGYVYTGDIGYFDDDGYLAIVDRKKDMIIASGYNIYPIEIDNVLFDHDKILEACTIGVPDPYRGETVKAFVVLKPGESMTEEEVQAYARERLAAYKVPGTVEFVDALPKSAVGKILRRELRDRELAKTKAASQ
ncbi:MAG: long-chain-fatty-acid--CoA ligase [Candidatus Geothermincolia bacterium]